MKIKDYPINIMLKKFHINFFFIMDILYWFFCKWQKNTRYSVEDKNVILKPIRKIGNIPEESSGG